MHTMRKFSLPDSSSEPVPDSPDPLSALARTSPTRIAVVEEDIDQPKDFEEYKQKYENICLIGSGTYGAVYFIRFGTN